MADTVVDLRGDGGCSPLEPAAKKHRSGAKDDVKARAKYDAPQVREAQWTPTMDTSDTDDAVDTSAAGAVPVVITVVGFEDAYPETAEKKAAVKKRLDEIADALKQAIVERGQHVMINCKRGRNRSAALTALVLGLIEDITPLQALGRMISAGNAPLQALGVGHFLMSRGAGNGVQFFLESVLDDGNPFKLVLAKGDREDWSPALLLDGNHDTRASDAEHGRVGHVWFCADSGVGDASEREWRFRQPLASTPSSYQLTIYDGTGDMGRLDIGNEGGAKDSVEKDRLPDVIVNLSGKQLFDEKACSLGGVAAMLNGLATTRRQARRLGSDPQRKRA